jgi:hypothetical protein
MVGGNLTATEEMMFVYNGVNFTSMVPPIPSVPPQTTFYVRPDGNDNNSGFANTPAAAFLTISGAMFAIKSRYISQNTITVRVADGTYADSFGESQAYIANWSIIGNSANPGNVVVTAASTSSGSYPPHAIIIGRACVVSATGNMTVTGFTFQSNIENVAASGGFLSLVNCNFTAPVGGDVPIKAHWSGRVQLFGNCQYSGATAASAIFASDFGGSVQLGFYDGIYNNTLIFNIAGTPIITVATALAVASSSIVIYNPAVTFTGGIPACRQWQAQSGAGIAFNTGVTTIFPGTLPGVVIPPGWTN